MPCRRPCGRRRTWSRGPHPRPANGTNGFGDLRSAIIFLSLNEQPCRHENSPFWLPHPTARSSRGPALAPTDIAPLTVRCRLLQEIKKYPGAHPDAELLPALGSRRDGIAATAPTSAHKDRGADPRLEGPREIILTEIGGADPSSGVAQEASSPQGPPRARCPRRCAAMSLAATGQFAPSGKEWLSARRRRM
jgi:hypothetical protein